MANPMYFHQHSGFAGYSAPSLRSPASALNSNPGISPCELCGVDGTGFEKLEDLCADMMAPRRNTLKYTDLRYKCQEKLVKVGAYKKSLPESGRSGPVSRWAPRIVNRACKVRCQAGSCPQYCLLSCRQGLGPWSACGSSHRPPP